MFEHGKRISSFTPTPTLYAMRLSQLSRVRARGLAVLSTLLALSQPATAAEDQSSKTALDWIVAEQIVQRIGEITFPDRTFDIRDYGAKADGSTDATQAIRDAIQACHEAGGGKVLVSGGKYLSGAIHLLSNVNLHIDEGATLLFKTDPDAYLPAVFTRWEGVELYNYSALIYAYGQQNIGITGKGTLDGQSSDDNWWPWKGPRKGQPEWAKHQRAARDRLFKMAEDGVPVEERRFGNGDYLRPNFIQPYNCEGVLIEDVTILNSPMWEVHPVLCEKVIVRGITVVSHGPNNDGCNPESCKDVLIENCIFDTGDDCIAIKSGRNNDGRRLNVPSENIVIRNCEMRDGHGGVVIGSEVSGGARNIYIENCEMSSPNLDRALRFKTNSVRGGLIENIYARNIRVGEVADAVIKVNFLYEEGDGGDFTPIVRNIVVENLSSLKSPHALYLVGYERSPIRGIRLIDCNFQGVKKPSMLLHVGDLSMENTTIQQGSPKMNQWGEPVSND